MYLTRPHMDYLACTLVPCLAHSQATYFTSTPVIVITYMFRSGSNKTSVPGSKLMSTTNCTFTSVYIALAPSVAYVQDSGAG